MASKRRGGESRLSLEGLGGQTIDGRVVKAIYTHGAKERIRTVVFTRGGRVRMEIGRLVGELLRVKGYGE